MPEFAYPWAFLLALPVAGLVWLWWRRRQAGLRFSGVTLVHYLPPGRTTWARRGGLWLRALALGCLVTAVAGPRWPDPGSRVPTEGLSIVLVLDVSDSMKHADFLHGAEVMTRWEAVRKIVRLFMKGGEEEGVTFAGRPNDLFGLVTFAQRPETDCPLTLDHEALLGILEEETPRLLQGTNPGDALAWGLHLLSKAPTRRKVILFITDGEDNVKGDSLRPKAAAHLAAAMHAPIYAVEVEPLPDESRPDEGKAARELMEEIAKISSGAFFSAKDTDGLARAYAAIDQMERDRIETYQYRRYYEADAWLAGTALGVFLLLIALEATRWRTAP